MCSTKGVDKYVGFTVQLGHFLMQQAQRMLTVMSVLQCLSLIHI